MQLCPYLGMASLQGVLVINNFVSNRESTCRLSASGEYILYSVTQRNVRLSGDAGMIPISMIIRENIECYALRGTRVIGSTIRPGSMV